MSTGPDKSFATWLQAALDERGWKAADLAKRSGTDANDRPVINASTVSRWLNPPYSKPREHVTVLAEILGVPKADVLRAAGMLDEGLEGDTYKLASDYATLSRRDQQQVKTLVDELLSKSRRGKKPRGSVSRSG